MQVDQQIIDDCIRGDRRAQFALYKLCYPPLMGVCLRYRKEERDAAGMLNQAFLKILDNLHRYRPEVPFQAWAKRITINVLIDDFRKGRKVRELIDYKDFTADGPHEAGIDYNKAEAVMAAEELEQLIQSLPTVSRKVFNLFAIDGYSHAEIGAMLGISEGTSRWHLSSARRKLQELIQKAMGSSRVI